MGPVLFFHFPQPSVWSHHYRFSLKAMFTFLGRISLFIIIRSVFPMPFLAQPSQCTFRSLTSFTWYLESCQSRIFECIFRFHPVARISIHFLLGLSQKPSLPCCITEEGVFTTPPSWQYHFHPHPIQSDCTICFRSSISYVVQGPARFATNWMDC